ncbi:hypothetical protein EJB05_00928, partial [Eragrostis curvula]
MGAEKRKEIEEHEYAQPLKTFAGRVVGMSRGKCSSNVIEKCLIHGDYEEKQLIINEVFSSGGEPDALTVMVGDPFANYVVQKVMETCDDWQRQMILRRLKTYLGELSSNAYGRHIVAPLMKLIQTGERTQPTHRLLRQARNAPTAAGRY